MTENNSDIQHSKEFFENQLAILRRQYRFIQGRIDALEEKVKQLPGLSSTGEAPKQSTEVSAPEAQAGKPEPALPQVPEPARKAHVITKEAPSARKPSEDMELAFGRYWLNKIGVVIFALGVGFLITYSFKYFTPLLKISFGYLLSVALFFWGSRLEKKEKFLRFGRVLIGSAWAMTYFTTFAMHHFEASRVIQNQFVDIVLLALVATGMVIHSVKYKSESMTSMALCVAYVTSTLGAVTSFTFISCFFLAVIVLILAYKYQWMHMLFFGVGLTYCVHAAWVLPNMGTGPMTDAAWGVFPGLYQPFLSLIFLASYWLLFFLGLHMIRSRDPLVCRRLTLANFFNFVLFYALAYRSIMDLFYAERFEIIFGLGLVYVLAALLMKRRKREKVYMSDLVVGIMVMTLAIPLKFLPRETLLIWITEIPFLLMAGFLLKHKTLRVLSYVVLILFLIKFTLLSVFPAGPMRVLSFPGFSWDWYEFMYLMTSLSLGFCALAGERQRRMTGLDQTDLFFNHGFSALAFFYFTSYTFVLWSILDQGMITLALIFELLLLYVLSLAVGMKRLRVYGALLLAFIIVPATVGDFYAHYSGPVYAIILAEVLILLIMYGFNRQLRLNQGVLGKAGLALPVKNVASKNEEFVIFISAMALLVNHVYQHVAGEWISLALGVSGVLLIAAGILSKDKTVRVGGLFLLVLSLIRVVFVDLSHLDIVFKIISFIILGALFVGISYGYNYYMGAEKKDIPE